MIFFVSLVSPEGYSTLRGYHSLFTVPDHRHVTVLVRVTGGHRPVTSRFAAQFTLTYDVTLVVTMTGRRECSEQQLKTAFKN